MRPRHLSLFHGGRCSCTRCRVEARAVIVLLAVIGLGLAAFGFWLDAQWIRFVVDR